MVKTEGTLITVSVKNVQTFKSENEKRSENFAVNEGYKGVPSFMSV